MNGTDYCSHVLSSASSVYLCTDACKHHPAGLGSCACPFAENACVADHGPADVVATVPTAGRPVPPPAPSGDEFGRAADAGIAVARATYAQRGGQYGDTYALGPAFDAAVRLRDAEALVRVKLRRLLMTELGHRDSVVDLIAYAAAYLTWADEHGGWWNGT